MFHKYPSNKKDDSYKINNSLIFDGNAWLDKTWSTAPTNSKKYTISFWTKRAEIDIYQYIYSSNQRGCDGIDELAFANTTYSDPLGSIKMAYGAGSTGLETTKAGYRDCSSWYHVCYYFDSTIPKESVFINGVLQDEITIHTPIAQNIDTVITQNGYTLTIGGRASAGAVDTGSTVRGAISELHLIDGQVLGPENFALEDSKGVYNPIPYEGTYGTNGFYLKFTSEDSQPFGHDYSGNGNNFLSYGTAGSEVSDTPTNNYCTLNPADKNSVATLSGGNLIISQDAVPVAARANATFPVSSGRWYWEVDCISAAVPNFVWMGGGPQSNDMTAPGVSSAPGWCLCGDSGALDIYVNSTNNKRLEGKGPAVGSMMMCAVDVDRQCVWTGKDGVWIDLSGGSASSSQIIAEIEGVGTSYGWTDPAIAVAGENWSFAASRSAIASVMEMNFGQRSWAHEPPSGYKALCTQNLPDTLVNPKEHFGATTWTGDGTSPRAITTGIGAGLTWGKVRDVGSSHQLYDTVRGAGPNNDLASNATYPSGGGNAASEGYLSEFESNGFVVTNGSGGANVYWNDNGKKYVAWNFRGGDTEEYNYDGSIMSRVTANKDMGFSVVKYSGDSVNGATIGHGLGKPPALVILKSLNIDNWWPVGSDVLGSSWDAQLYLNEPNVSQPTTTFFNSTPPTSSVVTLGDHPEVNNAGVDYIAYCFANTEMVQVGSYVGNGLVDGSMVSLPFKPAYFMCKLINGEVANWAVYDNARNTYNSVDAELYPDSTSDEVYAANLDFLSNGIKFRGGRTVDNKNGGNYLYLAISDQNFKHSRGR